MRWRGPLESAALLTVLPVPRGAAGSTRGVLPWAPLVGLVLGGIAAGVALLGEQWISAPAGAVLAVAVLAALTRGLHLDGLADTADGFGPMRGPQRALEVMHQSDVGPFGVVTLVLTLLLQVACISALLVTPQGWAALWLAVTVARLAMARTGLPGVATAEGSSLGALVTGTVSGRWLAAWGLVVLGLVGLVAVTTTDEVGTVVGLAVSALAGLLAAELLYRRARARLGGVTGDAMGAMGETATAATLLVAAVAV